MTPCSWGLHMRCVTLTVLTLATMTLPVSAQQSAERDAVRRAALDYLEGFYEGDSTKLVRSVRRDVRKVGYYKAREATIHGAGRYMTIWRRESGAWKIVRFMLNEAK